MRLIGLKIVDLPFLSRGQLIELWLSEEVASSLKVAALEYLGDYGQQSDLALIREEYRRNVSQTAKAAVNAILWIASRNDRSHAMDLLHEIQPASVDVELLKELFEDPADLADEDLSRLVQHRNADVRIRAAKILCERGKINETQAESFLYDINADMRYEAVQCLLKAGRELSVDHVQKILIRPVSKDSIPLGRQRDAAGEALFELFQRNLVMKLPITQLESDADTEIFDQNAFFALTLKNYATRKSELLSAIQDGFAERFTLLLDGIVERLGASETTERIRSLGQTLCEVYTRQGLDIVCNKLDKQDLPFVRSVLEKGAVSCSSADFRYLARHGQWRDIQLIINLLKRSNQNKNPLLVLSAPDSSIVEEATCAMLKLGKHRLADLISLHMSHELLASLVAKIPDRAFLGLTDEQVQPLVHNDSDAVRRSAVRKYIRVFSRKRIKTFLQDYMTAPSFFYNVIYWLDLGASCTKAHVLSATALQK